MNSSRPSTKSAPSPPRKTRSDGFTLLELLVALTIFSLVVGMAMFSIRYAFGVFRHLDAPFVEDTQAVTRLRDCIASSFVYVGERSDMFNRNKEFFTLFNGESDQMTFVSTKPLASTGAALCQLSLKDNKLVLAEAPLYARDSNFLNPSMESKERRETVIVADVKGLNLEYWQGDKQSPSLKEELPTLVRISFAADDKPHEIYCRLQSDYQDKKKIVRASYEKP